MRKKNLLFADVYPEGTEECGKCGSKNLLGESFGIWFDRPYSLKSLCPDCYNYEMRIKNATQKSKYESGEKEPSYTNEIVCPWCGYEMGDSWEIEDDEDEIDCEECSKTFSYTRNVEVTYSSSRVDKD